MRPGAAARGWRAAIAAVLSLFLLAAGCSSGASTPAGSAGPSTMAQYYAQRLNWTPCDNGFQCAHLLVPFNYRDTGGRRFSLPVVKLAAAQPSRRAGALVVNPGGPGGSGVQYALAARSEFPAAVLDRFDIVGFDPRGVGGSEPALHCLTGPELDEYFATDDDPATAAQLATVVSQSKQYAARCEQNSAALLPYVGRPGHPVADRRHHPGQRLRGRVLLVHDVVPGAGRLPVRPSFSRRREDRVFDRTS